MAPNHPEPATAPAPRPTLFTYTAELLELHLALLEAEGELTPELLTKIAAATQGLEGKVDGWSYLIRELEHESAKQKAQGQLIAAQAEPHFDRAKQLAARADGLKRTLLGQLKALDKTRLVGELHRIRRQKNSQAPVTFLMLEPAKYPAEYHRIELDTAKVAAALRANGEAAAELAGLALLEPVGEHLRIEMA